MGLSNLDVLSRNPYALRDNLVLNDLAVAEQELMRFKRAGGDSIVDATSIGIGRDPEALRSISRATGLNIIAGCGYYTGDTHPADMDDRTVEQIRHEILTDLTVGIDGTRIRAGVIGEIGTSAEILPTERKSLIAAAEVQRETGVGVIVHTYPWGDVRPGGGGDPHRHGGAAAQDRHQPRRRGDRPRLLQAALPRPAPSSSSMISARSTTLTGAIAGFAGGVFARDIERVRAVKALVDAGYLHNLLLANDVCLKTLLHKYGGWGYDHVLTHIVPMLLDEGVTEPQIDVLLRENPRRFLDVE